RTVVLGSYAGGTVTIRFKGTRGSSFYGDMAIDDIAIDEAPTCVPPTGVAVSNITPTGATITWNASITVPGNGYDYYYNTTGVAPTATTTASGNTSSTSKNLTSLTSNTVYYFWVR